MDGNQKTELFDPKDADRYLLYSRPEIMRVLRDLAKKPDIVTAYLNGGSNYFLTAVLGVLPERDMVVLDYASSEELNELALRAERVVCVTSHDHVRVRFTCTQLQKAKFQNRTALAAPLPASVYRPQRREFFRVVTPVYNPLILRIPQAEADPLELAVVDLSCGGVGVYDPHELLNHGPGELIKGCGLELPGFGHIAFDVEIRNVLRVHLNDGSETRRIGCEFKGLPIDASALLQRYIHKLQLENNRQ